MAGRPPTGEGALAPDALRAMTAKDRRMTLPVDKANTLRQYIALMERVNRSVGTSPMLEHAEIARLSELRHALTDKFIEEHVDREDVNGPVLPD